MIDEYVYRNYLDNLLAGRRTACVETVKAMVDAGTPVQDLYVELFQRSMYEVGELWEFNKISVANEHLATSITESLMALVYPTIFGAEHIGRSAVVSCGANEFHQIGGRMVADILELHGWHGYFLGANTPADELIKMIGEKHPDLVALSLSVYYNLEPLTKMVEGVAGAFPEQRIVLGGQAFRWGGEELSGRFEQVEIVRSIEALEAFIGAS